MIDESNKKDQPKTIIKPKTVSQPKPILKTFIKKQKNTSSKKGGK